MHDRDSTSRRREQAPLDAQVGEDQDWAVDDVHLRCHVTGGQRCVASDHDQLVAGLCQHAQRRLTVGLCCSCQV